MDKTDHLERVSTTGHDTPEVQEQLDLAAVAAAAAQGSQDGAAALPSQSGGTTRTSDIASQFSTRGSPLFGFGNTLRCSAAEASSSQHAAATMHDAATATSKQAQPSSAHAPPSGSAPRPRSGRSATVPGKLHMSPAEVAVAAEQIRRLQAMVAAEHGEGRSYDPAHTSVLRQAAERNLASRNRCKRGYTVTHGPSLGQGGQNGARGAENSSVPPRGRQRRPQTSGWPSTP